MSRLAVFDFDGTIFRSPDRPDWWDDAMMAIGYKKNWWANAHSLNRPCVPDKPGSDWWIGKTVQAAKQAISDPNTWAILMTGRADKYFRYRVPELLKQAGLKFDEVHLSPGQDHTYFKKDIIVDRLQRWPEIDTVEIWDDNTRNLKLFADTAEKLGKVAITHPVKVQAHAPICTMQTFEQAPENLWFTASRVADRWLSQNRVRRVTYGEDD